MLTLPEHIIKVEPITPSISISWMLGSRCNYDCMYCPTELHDVTSKHPSFEQLVSVWDSMVKKTQHQHIGYKLSFTGGEVSANRNFIPLLEHIRSSNVTINQIVVTTNGSASEKYYIRLSHLVDAISFSVHSEFFNEQDFFNKVLAVSKLMQRPKKSTHVNIMDEFWNQQRIPLYTAWLDQHNISYSVNKIDYLQKIRSTPVLKGVYNIEQI
jgi:molybdenum cofactor biosynthesis enzyme MoaA